MSSINTAKTKFEHANPILNVRSMADSITYYVEALGFSNADWGNDHFTLVSRDSTGIYLCQGGQGQPGTWVWVGVKDVAVLYEEYKASGARILRAPENYSWAYELHVEDPDGHVLRFGSEPRTDLPFASPAF
jgi:predicted enzyme related to lactoylglutathione lyase